MHNHKNECMTFAVSSLLSAFSLEGDLKAFFTALNHPTDLCGFPMIAETPLHFQVSLEHLHLCKVHHQNI
jgi:hypothetical protein